MANTFHTSIQKALDNPNLQVALDANAERRLKARQLAYTSLPEDWEVMRQHAHAVRAQTVANLERYLEQFVSNVEANGVQVHRAADAVQAIQQVLAIAAQSRHRMKHADGPLLVAKSKTMVSEEIGLNHALEAVGFRVVETDLGEYIVQLRGERPAHIITPAVHLRREDIGQTFHDKLGLPLTDDISIMTTAARRELRQVFIDADIGISGVNFGVAETGALCILTNEGNGRMVTTLPPVHIALMGIERLVPTPDDLALMLYLLPRSATGQKLTVYTSLIHAPRRKGEPDGSLDRHLILVDNGRRAMRESPLSEALLCIRCGACLNACPVFREIGGHAYVNQRGESSTYPGPIGSVISPGLFGQAEFGWLARASSLCGACREACPVDINLPELLLRVRAGLVAHQEPSTSGSVTPAASNAPLPISWGLPVYAWLATHPSWFAFAQRTAGVLSRIIPSSSGWLRLPAFTGWGYSRDLPRPSPRPFRDQFQARDLGRPKPQENVEESHTQDESVVENRAVDQAIESTQLMERFAQEFTAVGGTFTVCMKGDVNRLVLALLAERGIQSVLAWDEQELPEGLLAAVVKASIQIFRNPEPDAQAGLTGAIAAIAETGTLALPGGVGRPLTASLLPEIHIVVLQANQLYANLAQVFRLREIQEAGAVAFVTGPSRTADIEMTLTIGVHGPREVHVFCLT